MQLALITMPIKLVSNQGNYSVVKQPISFRFGSAAHELLSHVTNFVC